MGGVPLFLSSPGGIVGNITRWGRSYTLPSEEIRSRQPLLKGEEEKKREEIERIVRRLRAIDRKVRAHELAHMSVGGQYAGAPHYTYVRGPDGQLYAVAGEVPIDVSPEKDPEATVKKMQQVIAAALAPADPSPRTTGLPPWLRSKWQKPSTNWPKKGQKSSTATFPKGRTLWSGSCEGREIPTHQKGEKGTTVQPLRGKRRNLISTAGLKMEILPSVIKH